MPACNERTIREGECPISSVCPTCLNGPCTVCPPSNLAATIPAAPNKAKVQADVEAVVLVTRINTFLDLHTAGELTQPLSASAHTLLRDAVAMLVKQQTIVTITDKA